MNRRKQDLIFLTTFVLLSFSIAFNKPKSFFEIIFNSFDGVQNQAAVVEAPLFESDVITTPLATLPSITKIIPRNFTPKSSSRKTAATVNSTPCYVYTPDYGTPAATFSVTVARSTNISDTKIIQVAHQNPPTILQDMYFVPSNPNSSCLLLLLYNEAVVESFVANGVIIPAIEWGLSYYYNSYEYFLTPMGTFYANAFQEIAASTVQQRIDREDTIIRHIDGNHTLINRQANHPISSNPSWYYYVDSSGPATNCQKISGTGPKKIIFMRGDGWNSWTADLLWYATAARDQLLFTEPFKTPADQFSFYVDLKKQSQSAALTGTVATVKAQSSCIVSANEDVTYVYLYKDTGTSKGTFSLPKSSSANGRVSFIEYADFTNATKGALTIVREIGRNIGNLFYEVNPSPASTSVVTIENNCGFNPFTAFRDSATNHIYGAVDQSPCFRSPYYRPNGTSLMGTGYSSSLAVTNPANKFDVISCGYIKAGLANEALTKDNALKYWPACKALDTAKDGIPPVISTAQTPTIVSIYRALPTSYVQNGTLDVSELAITRGSEATIIGSGFTSTGNSVYLTDRDDPLKVYDITNLTSSNSGQILKFTIPSEIPPGIFNRYSVKVGALNSDWSNSINFDLHGADPNNLVAQAIKKGQFDFSWSDNSSDELNFELESFSESRAKFIKTDNINSQVGVVSGPSSFIKTGILPSKTGTYRLRAKFGDGEYSDYTNTVTVTSLPKPLPPVLSAVSGPNNTIVLSWTITDAEGITGYDIDSIPSGDHVTDEMLANPGALTYSFIDGLTERSDGRVITLASNTMYCYVVIAKVNLVNRSDDSNTACARTSLIGISFDIPTDPLVGNQTIPLNIGNTATGQISSVDFSIDGVNVGTDNSAPWNMSFDTTQFANGTHNISSIIRYVSPKPPTITPPQPITINNPLPPAPVLDSSNRERASRGDFIGGRSITVTGSGFSSTGNRVQLTMPTSVIRGRNNPTSILNKTKFNLASIIDSLVPTPTTVTGSLTTYEINNIPSSTGTSIMFTIPAGIPTATYTLKVAALNSGWSEGVSVQIYSRRLTLMDESKGAGTNPGPTPNPNLPPNPNVTAGRSLTVRIVSGSIFTPTGNKVKLTSSNSSNGSPQTYEVNNIPSSDGKNITFTIPADIPAATYELKIITSNGKTSLPISVNITTHADQ